MSRIACVQSLRKLLDTANQAALSLGAHLSLPLSNPKLLSLYRQQTNISYAVQQVIELNLALDNSIAGNTPSRLGRSERTPCCTITAQTCGNHFRGGHTS